MTETFAPAADPVAESARHICDALLAAGHELRVLTTSVGSSTYRNAQVERTRTLFPLAAIRTAAHEFAPDVIQFISPRAMGAAALRALEPAGVPMVVLDPTPLHPRVGTVLASSQSSAKVLGTAGIHAQVWQPGVRTDEHHPGLRSAELHDKWARVGKAGGPLTIVGYVGHVGPPTSKAVRRLAKVAALEGVRLVVLGCGSGTPTLKQAGAKIVGDATGLELARAIASLDVLVQPRKGDASLCAVRKALASGVPVVAFATGAAKEVIEDGVNGVLVPTSFGAGALTAAITKLAGDAPGRAEIAARARGSISGRTWADAVAELVGIYEPLRPAV
ncbi:MAG: glycosyl transferase, group 1 [Marmoricola sp.]|nr:glycosyl transferase, group 1 [Marmoricola sp.]